MSKTNNNKSTSNSKENKLSKKSNNESKIDNNYNTNKVTNSNISKSDNDTSKDKTNENPNTSNNYTSIFAKLLTYLGILTIFVSLLLLSLIFFPVIKEEINYLFYSKNYLKSGYTNNSDSKEQMVLVPVDNDFSIIIPKINANSKVIENVDPFNSTEYQLALSKGVAHAKTSTTPDNDGNVFLFAHSSDNFYNANRYNSIFYLINKLEPNDAFYIAYQNNLYKYQITEKKIVNPEEIDYLKSTYKVPTIDIQNNTSDKTKLLDTKSYVESEDYIDIEGIFEKQNLTNKTATLMSCWPPGTTNKRIIVNGLLTQITPIND